MCCLRLTLAILRRHAISMAFSRCRKCRKCRKCPKPVTIQNSPVGQVGQQQQPCSVTHLHESLLTEPSSSSSSSSLEERTINMLVVRSLIRYNNYTQQSQYMCKRLSKSDGRLRAGSGEPRAGSRAGESGGDRRNGSKE